MFARAATAADAAPPLLVLHGGPGVSSRYITRINETLCDDMRLVLYDQLGSGESDWPDDPSLWQVQRFVDEVETVRTTLGLGDVSLYGQSWGGMLALAYTLQHPANVQALVLSNTYANGRAYLLDISDHRVSLGHDMHAAMLRHVTLVESSVEGLLARDVGER